MKTIRHSETLFYYDGPQVFEARDTIGGHYIGVAVEPEGDEERYLVAGVAPERLWEFRIGLRDLRSLLCEGSDGEWYLATAPQGLEEPLKLIPQERPLAESEHLPKEGFVLEVDPSKELSKFLHETMEYISPKFKTCGEEWSSGLVELVGTLKFADLTRGCWLLATEQGPCAGLVKASAESMLTGLRLGGDYRFFCHAKHFDAHARHWQGSLAADSRLDKAIYMLDQRPLDFEQA